MNIFSIFERRNKAKETEIPKDNPCNNMSEALSNLLKKFGEVNPMNISAFFSGLNLISNQIAIINWLYKDSKGESLNKRHYLYHLFDRSVLTRFHIVKNIVKDIILYGNGFLYIKRDIETGRPISVEYSPAEDTMIFMDSNKYNLYFMNPKLNNNWDNGENFCHFYINSNDGYQGTSIKSYAYKTIKLSGETEKAASDYYASGGQLFGLITVNGATPMVGTKEKQIESLRNSWDEARSKSSGTGCVFIPQDLKYTPLSSNAKDANMLESRQFNVVEIARFFNINPLLLGDLSKNVYGSLAEAQKEFIIHCISPYIKMMEEELNRKLLMPSKYLDEFIDLDEDSILATDQEKQANTYTTLVKNGIMTANEARVRLNLPEKENADDLIIPFTNINDNKLDNSSNADNEEKNQEE